MASVRPEYGPSAVTLARPQWARLPRAGRVAVIAVVALVVLALAYRVVVGSDRTLNDVLVRSPVAFTLGYPSGMERVAPEGREVLHLRSDGSRTTRESFAVTPLTLAAYRGDASAAFLRASATMVDAMRRIYPGFVYRGEGRVRVAELPGYQIQFSFRRAGRTVYGRRVLLVPDMPGARQGIDITMLADRSTAVVNVDAVGANGVLKTPYRSLRFGTERP